MKTTFGHFLDKKVRDAKRQLHILRDIFQKHDMAVDDFTEGIDFTEEPYVFVKNTISDASFAGVRIYKIGDDIAFRVQMEPKTEPFGAAYSLDIQGMFNDLIEDYSEEETGKKIMEAVVKEMKQFFVLSAKAERDYQGAGVLIGGLGGKIVIQSNGVADFSTNMN